MKVEWRMDDASLASSFYFALNVAFALTVLFMPNLTTDFYADTNKTNKSIELLPRVYKYNKNFIK